MSDALNEKSDKGKIDFGKKIAMYVVQKKPYFKILKIVPHIVIYLI